MNFSAMDPTTRFATSMLADSTAKCNQISSKSRSASRRPGFVSLATGFQFFFDHATAAAGFDAICELLDTARLVLGELAPFNGIESCANIAPKSFDVLIALLQKP